MANVLIGNIMLNEFEFQSGYYVHIWINTFGKGMNPIILPAISWIAPLQFFYKDGIGIK